MGRLPKPLTPEQLESFRPGNVPFVIAEEEAALKVPISAEQRAHNKALRLRHGGSPDDGLTVRFLKTCPSGAAGETLVVDAGYARRYIADGTAESAE